MRFARFACVAVAAGAAALTASPAAFASSGGSAASIKLHPSEARHGAIVGVRVNCTGYPHPHPTKVFSRAFTGKVTLKGLPGHPRQFQGAGKVRTKVAPGNYKVAGDCLSAWQKPKPGSAFVTTLTVKGRGHGHHHVVVVPHGGANTGDGASLASTASTPSVIEGGAVTAGGLGLGLAALRRRRVGARG